MKMCYFNASINILIEGLRTFILKD